MKLNYIFAPSRSEYRTFDTKRLRQAFLVEEVFRPGAMVLQATDLDRAIIGGIEPLDTPIELAGIEELRTEFFFDRREAGIINIGGPGTITVDDTIYPLSKRDCLYVGRGARRVVFGAEDPANPPVFYLLSYPAHREFPTTLAPSTEATRLDLGSSETCNERTIFQYVHEKGVSSCQLVMGLTELRPGSVWNTMPCHTHLRRSEIYLYYDLDSENQVMHLAGTPDETRALWVRNRQAALSPSWSVHSGAGTAAYSFIWGMGGENQSFGDMDIVGITDLQ